MEFFPWNLLTALIREMFLTVSIPHLKLPWFLWRDGELDVTAHAEQRIYEILSYLYEE